MEVGVEDQGATKVKRFFAVDFSDVLSMIISIVALVVAMQARTDSIEANRIARDANAISQESNVYASEAITMATEANEIAREANDLTYSSGMANIAVYLGPTEGRDAAMVIGIGCKAGGSHPYGFVMSSSFGLMLANVGIKSADLVKITMENERWWWNIVAFVEGQEQVLPITIEPGYRKRWVFVATAQGHYRLPEDVEEGRADWAETSNPFTLRLEFDDGQTIERTARHWLTYSGKDNYQVPCNEVEANYIAAHPK